MAVFAFMIWFEALALWRDGLWNDLIAFGLMWALGLVLGVALIHDWPRPNVVAWLEAIFAPFIPIL